MEQDRTESTDLAAEQPERVATMAAQWQAWATRAGVQPWPFANKPKIPPKVRR